MAVTSRGYGSGKRVVISKIWQLGRMGHGWRRRMAAWGVDRSRCRRRTKAEHKLGSGLIHMYTNNTTGLLPLECYIQGGLRYQANCDGLTTSSKPIFLDFRLRSGSPLGCHITPPPITLEMTLSTRLSTQGQPHTWLPDLAWVSTPWARER